MNTPSTRNLLITTALSVGMLAEAAPTKKIEVRRLEMATKLQACLTAGFEDWNVTYLARDEQSGKGVVTVSTGWLSDEMKRCKRTATSAKPAEKCPKMPVYIGGGRIQSVPDENEKQTEHFDDTNKPGTGKLKMLYDEIRSLDTKESNGRVKAVVCFGRKTFSPHDEKILDNMGIPKCTASITEAEAQKEYDDFMVEAVDQCNYRAEIKTDFGAKLRAALRKK